MEKFTASEKILAEKTVCIMLLQGKNPQGHAVFAYIAVRADMLDIFMAAQDKPDFVPEKYGVILESGEGEPPEDIRAKMESEYGFKHDTMTFLSNPKDDTAH